MSKQVDLIEKLTAGFQPYFLTVENESHLHSADRGGESHFKVVLVSDRFNGVRKVARHRSVYRLLRTDLDNGIHALALHTFTPEEWAQSGQAIPESTDCLGHGH